MNISIKVGSRVSWKWGAAKYVGTVTDRKPFDQVTTCEKRGQLVVVQLDDGAVATVWTSELKLRKA